MKEKLTVKDLCTAKVLCKYELARLYENGTSGSEWAEQVQELSDVVGELLKETPKAPQIAGTCNYWIATSEDFDDAVKGCTQALQRAKDGAEVEVAFNVLDATWRHLLVELVGIGYALSVNHKPLSSWYYVTFYKGGKVFK